MTERWGRSPEGAEDFCNTVFGDGIPGKMFEPTSLNNSDTVLDAFGKYWGSGWYWIGVASWLHIGEPDPPPRPSHCRSHRPH